MNAALLSQFPNTRYHPDQRLLTWHPCGILDDQLADRIVEFIEWEEQGAEAPFHRYTDLSGLTQIRLKVGHAFRVAERRRTGYVGRKSVKSAFFATSIVAFGIARLYEDLMKGAPIEVRAFLNRDVAAAWLGVPLRLLQPEPSEREE